MADEESIKIRSPFVIPVFTVSDAYPFDSFEGSGSLDADKWRNTERYERSSEGMVTVAGAPFFTSSRLPASFFTIWFKDAANFSYQVRAEYAFDADSSVEQRVGIIIRGNGSLASGAFIQADLILADGALSVEIYHNNGSVVSRLFSSAVESPLPTHTGFFTLSYSRNPQAQTFIPSVQVVPTGGTILNGSGPTLTFIQDADLGLKSAIALGAKGATIPDGLRIEVVDGGPV